MISDIRRMIGFIKVEESRGVIRVSGLPTHAVTKDIYRIWATSKIAKYLFIRVKSNELTFPSFFAVEFERIVTTILDTKGIRTNRRALRQVLEGLHRDTWMARINQSHPDVLDMSQLSQIKFAMLDHQMAFLRQYNYIKPRYGLRGVLLMVPPGGGKTIADIAVAVCAKADVVFVVAPKNSIYEVWKKTLLNDMTHPQRVWIADESIDFDYTARWNVFHYEALERALQLAQVCKMKRVVIILDESHNFNDAESLRTERFLDLCETTNPTDIVWASGTPIKAMGAETIPLIRSIDPLFTTDVEYRYKKIFGADASKAYDILSYRLGLISYKVPKSQFMSEQPVIKDIAVQIPNADYYTLPKLKVVMEKFIETQMDYYTRERPKYKAFYEECLRLYERHIKTRQERTDYEQYLKYVSMFVRQGFDTMTMGEQAKFCNLFEKRFIIPALPQTSRARFIDTKSVIKYVNLKVRGECLGRVLAKERANCHVDMVAHVDFAAIIDDAEKKTLVFTSFVDVVDKAFDRLTHDGYTPLRIYGATNNDLQGIIDRFRKEVDLNPMLATYQSLSTAVPMLMASTIIFLNAPFRHHEQEQAISRCSRLGQDKTVYCYRMFLDTGEVPNISTRSADIMKWSEDMVNQMLGLANIAPDIDVGLECFNDDLVAVNYVATQAVSRNW